MRIFAYSRKGAGKAENEDKIAVTGKTVLPELPDGEPVTCGFSGIIAVADGVGGNRAGAFASDFVTKRLDKLQSAEQICAASFNEMNRELIERSDGDPERKGTATTLSGIFFGGGTKILFHVGNTRVYALFNGALNALTDDDTTLNYLIKEGRMTSEEAEDFPRKNELISCFGNGDETCLDIKIKDISRLDVEAFLITSDGAHDFIKAGEFKRLFGEGKAPDELCRNIAKTAVENGSRDDISILLAYMT